MIRTVIEEDGAKLTGIAAQIHYIIGLIENQEPYSLKKLCEPHWGFDAVAWTGPILQFAKALRHNMGDACDTLDELIKTCDTIRKDHLWQEWERQQMAQGKSTDYVMVPISSLVANAD